ncbi:cytochrome P450 [Nocardioides zeae]|uniref:Cytochrome P450 n=1 Tax=Nocardioides zeae TaxID=1457234 RepID=A0A6P0HGP3_9ACTN|nr:cytochrome P450 [Nocardioides zeae]NEN77879.1 cytochrome P450 [Nocardioides zeae]
MTTQQADSATCPVTGARFSADSPEIATDFDVHSPAVADVAYERYAAMRAERPVAHSDLYGGHYVLTRYEDIHDVCRNPGVFSSESVNVPGSIGQDGPMIPIEVDPPDHTTYRQIITPLFSPKRMRAMEDHILEIVTELLDAMEGKEQVDFLNDFAKPLPTRVFLAMMGWPQEHAEQFHEWVDVIVLGVPGASEEEAMEARMGAAMQVYAYFAEMMDERDEQDVPEDDITQILLDGSFGDRDLTQFEILNILFLLLIAGLDTVKGALCHSVIYLAEHADQRHQLAEDPDVIPAAVEELLRYESAVIPARVVKEDVVVGDVQLRAGDKILIPFGAANRDPEVFEEPDEVDFTREPNPHLAFGAGPHRCVGSHLGRLELRIAFEELHRRFPDYRLDPDRPPVRHMSQIKGVASLHLLLGPA